MYNNPYMPNFQNNFNQQGLGERIDNQIAQLQQMKEQMKNNQQQPAINQTFQIAPANNHTMRFVDTIDDVSKEVVYFDTPFFSKDMSILWLKNVNGQIKTYELSEIVPKDAKDMQIEYLQAQIEELKGKVNHETNVRNVDEEQDATDTTTDDEPIRTTTKKSESTSVQKVSRSKK